MPTYFPDEADPLEDSKQWFIIGSVFCLIIAFASVGVGYLTSLGKATAERVSETIIDTVATPKDSFAMIKPKAKITLEIWNGTGNSSILASEITRISGLGFDVVSSQTYAKRIKANQLWVRKGSEMEITSQFSNLGVSTISGELKDGTASARLILGR